MFQTNLPQRGFKFACAATFFTPDMGEALVQMPQLNELLPKVTSVAIPHPPPACINVSSSKPFSGVALRCRPCRLAQLLMADPVDGPEFLGDVRAAAPNRVDVIRFGGPRTGPGVLGQWAAAQCARIAVPEDTGPITPVPAMRSAAHPKLTIRLLLRLGGMGSTGGGPSSGSMVMVW